jgi:hypothetical protein
MGSRGDNISDFQVPMQWHLVASVRQAFHFSLYSGDPCLPQTKWGLKLTPCTMTLGVV